MLFLDKFLGGEPLGDKAEPQVAAVLVLEEQYPVPHKLGVVDIEVLGVHLFLDLRAEVEDLLVRHHLPLKLGLQTLLVVLLGEKLEESLESPVSDRLAQIWDIDPVGGNTVLLCF